MQPYQKASQEIQRQGEVPIKAIKTGASLGASLYGGGLAASKVLPFLSKYIPADLAIKGLTKIDPRFGIFINTALKKGKSFDEIKQFIQGEVEKGQQQESETEPNLSPSGFPIKEKNQQQTNPKKQNAKDQRNIIEQYSPELHQMLSKHVTAGRSPTEAAALAANEGKGQKSFKAIIKKIQEDHKTPFESIVESIYGGGQYGGSVNPPQQNQQPQQPQQQGQQQAGSGQQALMSILQKIDQRLGK